MDKVKKAITAINKPIKKTNGYKTTVSALLFVIFAILGDRVPFLKENEQVIREVLEYALSVGVLHKGFRWILRNAKNIKDWSISNLKSLINKTWKKK